MLWQLHSHLLEGDVRLLGVPRLQWSDHVQGQLRNGVRFRARHRRESDDIQNQRPSVAGIATTRRERRVQEERNAQREEIAWTSGAGWMFGRIK